MITIAAMGILKTGAERELVERYLKMSRYKVAEREFDQKKTRDPDGALLGACPAGSFRIALDSSGQLMDSAEFARLVAAHGDLAFLIGAADGHGPRVRAEADLRLSFGRMTMPHFLARAVLAEQLYRAHTILTGHPYHRA
ncbi:ribosomal RNA large subunit methyltransferase H [Alphaproteobacteria bacterium]|nr:ribosomal RNA large subunit methyltransferase H [Alphaproteobacteria bacterium]